MLAARITFAHLSDEFSEVPTPRPKIVEITSKHDGKGNLVMVNSDPQRRAVPRAVQPLVPDP
jgi:hypothetical protein